MRNLICAILLFVGVTVQAANRYVRAGATGNGSGSDWLNAYASLPSTLNRGDIYYIADGNYSSYTFDDNANGSLSIVIKKCTPLDYGTNTGYDSTYCDGKATFSGGMIFTRPYYTIDGGKRNESNWKDHASYGFSVPGFYASRLAGGHVGNDCSADNITVRNVHVGTSTTSYSTSTQSEGFYISGFGGDSVACENWLIQKSLVQNVLVGIQCAGCKGLTVDSTMFYIGWGKEAIRGQVYAANAVIKNSIFEDSCQKDPEDPTSGCTAEIAMWDGSGFDNNEFYGNVFFKSTSEVNCCGVIVVGGSASSGFVGPGTNNSKAYNNTFVGLNILSTTHVIGFNGGSGNLIRNNLSYAIKVPNNGQVSWGGNTLSNNMNVSADPFVSLATRNYRLKNSIGAGFTLTSPYNVDIDGKSRGSDGVWDIGAFEFGGSPMPTRVIRSTPTLIRVTQ